MTLINPTPLALARMKAGFRSAAMAAESLGCSRVYLLQIECGRAKPGPALLELMARNYETTTENLAQMVAETRKAFTQRLLARMGEPIAPPEAG